MGSIIETKIVAPPSFPTELENLPDVTGTAPLGAVPIFNLGSGKFNLASLAIDMTSTTNGWVLTWNSATQTAIWAAK